jgi:DNA uptake protein ComE-like DNA-binding protein
MATPNLNQSQIANLNDPAWRRRHSRWRWGVWGTAGAYGAVFLIFVAAKSRSKKAIIAAAISALLLILIGVISSQMPVLTEAELAAAEGTTRIATGLDNAMGAVIFTMIAFNIWMSFYLQKEWLLWVVTKADRSDWVAENLKIKNVSLKEKPRTELQGSAVHIANDLQEDLDNLVSEPRQVSTPQESTVILSETPSATNAVDPNGISLGALINIPGVSEQLAEKIVTSRMTDGAFKSLEEMRIRLEIQPHEMLKIQDVFAFSERTTSSPTRRVLDV